MGYLVLPNPFLDPLQYRPHIILDLMVPKPQEANTEVFKSFLSFGIFILIEIMTFTIDFYSQFQVSAVEVHNEFIDRALSVKIVTTHSFLFQVLPQKDFRQCHVSAQLTGEWSEFRVVWNDSLSHRNPPLAPPRRGTAWFVYPLQGGELLGLFIPYGEGNCLGCLSLVISSKKGELVSPCLPTSSPPRRGTAWVVYPLRGGELLGLFISGYLLQKRGTR